MVEEGEKETDDDEKEEGEEGKIPVRVSGEEYEIDGERK